MYHTHVCMFMNICMCFCVHHIYMHVYEYMFACLYLGSLQCASIWLFQTSLVFSLSSPLRQPTFSTITQLNCPPHYFSFLFIAHILNIQHPHCKTDITCPILQVEIKKIKSLNQASQINMAWQWELKLVIALCKVSKMNRLISLCLTVDTSTPPHSRLHLTIQCCLGLTLSISMHSNSLLPALITWLRPFNIPLFSVSWLQMSVTEGH